MNAAKPFRVKYKDGLGKQKMSALRFSTSTGAREYALSLIDCGAVSCAVIKLDGRKYASIQSVTRKAGRG